MKSLLVLIFVCISSVLFGQQMHMNSSYIFNEMLVNPGATGSKKDYIPLHLNFRKQWTSFPGSPTTQSLSCHSEVEANFGFGGTLFNDNSGPSRRTGLNVNASYIMKLDGQNKSKFIGFGLGITLAQHVIDIDKLNTYFPDDPAVIRGYNNRIVPDANVGVYFKWKDNAFVGLSAYNLVQTNRDLYDFQNPLYNPLARTYYLLFGYDFPTESKMVYKTSALVRAIETGTFQFDVTGMAVWNNTVWFGLSYRNLDAVSALIGCQIGQFKIGYSYDYTLSDIGRYSSGSHEFFLELQMYNMPGSGGRNWFKRNLRYAPKI
ncbi:MAG: type IX secretion system membrane protein PorP/SprF [Crocinitomicaceae bacterium]|nr:type IX secretion system membrane protein PorP/SprF [Crocinitomicaceae bacterium]